ncbi:MAG: 16S rRNA (guanine(966)-N(2))-methyltransferase RsmD [Rhodobacteraceae bacterium]|nr:16S rRNA (guanine(966)-N(2))-methyltransferase RsmD [Paracoccaceae bacterium]
MRIIAGSKRGLRLASVGKGDTAAHLRPTSDRVRESLFNVITSGRHGDPVTGARVLDLFAGTGALGFEALSRGASQVTFVDDGSKASALLRDNTILMQAGGAVRVLRRDATRLGPCTADPFDLIFLDPPYGKGMGERALVAANGGAWLAPGALVVWEENTPQAAPPGFALLSSRRYGDTHVTFLERDPA